ncbi:unnamed protein product, partial [Polarella glacialis]
ASCSIKSPATHNSSAACRRALSAMHWHRCGRSSTVSVRFALSWSAWTRPARPQCSI